MKTLENIMAYIFVGIYLCVIYLWGREILSLFLKKDYELLFLAFIVSGIVVMIFGYWVKLRLASSQLDAKEEIELIKIKIISKEKITLRERLGLFLYEDNVKICNRIGIILLFIGAIIYVLKNIL
ncbi:hypothetical protein N5915_01795 [Arcobacter lacus]|uniref:hypothetical protein n=1 Tax=Arcobacter lacus TaxID=1912876 RepID=UPI0021BBA5AA|nr:hypothetical protein [Arcobacter lacus]MCT7908280.1 hypothetical protein [Arcobacter lacus]MCT7910768.1 hypothetical protein [Arcobacter lacus]